MSLMSQKVCATLAAIAIGLGTSGSASFADETLRKLSRIEITSTISGGKQLTLRSKHEFPRIEYFYANGNYMQCADEANGFGKYYFQGDELCGKAWSEPLCRSIYKNSRGELFLKFSGRNRPGSTAFKPLILSPITVPETCE